MGICLGLQLLFTRSEDFEYCEGLGIVEGKVESFSKYESVKKVPHVGWNKIEKNSSNSSLQPDPLKKIDGGEYFYFVHSYYVKPKFESDICTRSEYSSLEFCSSVLKDNVFACQFHPEKSGKKGLQILKEFFSNPITGV